MVKWKKGSGINDAQPLIPFRHFPFGPYACKPTSHFCCLYTATTLNLLVSPPPPRLLSSTACRCLWRSR